MKSEAPASASASAASGDQRLHPLSFVFVVLAQLRSYLVPLLLLIVAARSGAWEIWVVVASIPYSIIAVIQSAAVRYRFDPDELVVKSGVFFRRDRRLKYGRIQNIETVQGPLHRLLKVAEVRIETAGGVEPEARLQVLDIDQAEDVRRRLTEARARDRGDVVAADAAATGVEAAGGAQAAGGLPLLQLPLKEVTIYGLVDNRGFLVAAAAFGFAWQNGLLEIEGWPSTRLWGTLQTLLRGAWYRQPSEWSLQTLMLTFGVFALFVLAVRVLSVGWAIAKFYGFTLSREGSDLRTGCGLFTQVRAVVPLRRIQMLTVVENPLHRLMKRVGVRVETAGGEQLASASRQWLAPVLPAEDLPAFLRQIDPDLDLAAMSWQPVSAGARYRIFRLLLWFALPILALLVYAFGWFGLAGVPMLAALAWWAARRNAAEYGYALAPELVAFRSGWLWRRLSIARYSRIQVLSLSETPWDRRARMRTVTADTAGGGLHQIGIPYLDREVAQALFEWLEARVARAKFRWV